MRTARTFATVLVISLLPAIGWGQSLPGLTGTLLAKPKPQAQMPKLDPPLSLAELDFVMRRIENSVMAALKLPAPRQGVPVVQTKSATRAQIIERFDGLYEMTKAKFTNTPRKVEFDASLLQVAAAVRPKAIKLIQMGCVGPVSTLVTGSRDTLSLEDFGDAIGLLLVRLAELTHTPSARFSPDLIFDRMPEKPKTNKPPAGKPKSGG